MGDAFYFSCWLILAGCLGWEEILNIFKSESHYIGVTHGRWGWTDASCRIQYLYWTDRMLPKLLLAKGLWTICDVTGITSAPHHWLALMPAVWIIITLWTLQTFYSGIWLYQHSTVQCHNLYVNKTWCYKYCTYFQFLLLQWWQGPSRMRDLFFSNTETEFVYESLADYLSVL